MLTTRPCSSCDRRGVPVDRALLAPGVRERVLVLACGEVGSERVEACDHLGSLARVDEDIPVVLPPNRLLVVGARCLERRHVDVPDPAVGSDVDEQARCCVGDGVHEGHLRAELGLQTVVSERQGRGGGDGVDELGLRVERRVVEDGRYAFARRIRPDERRAPPRSSGRAPLSLAGRPSPSHRARDSTRASRRRPGTDRSEPSRARREVALPGRVRPRAPTPTSGRAACGGSRRERRPAPRRSDAKKRSWNGIGGGARTPDRRSRRARWRRVWRRRFR